MEHLDGQVEGLGTAGIDVQVPEHRHAVPPVFAVFVAFPVLDGHFHAVFEGRLDVAAAQALRIDQEVVADAVGIFGFLGDQGPFLAVALAEDAGVQGQAPAQLGRHALIGLVVQFQLVTRDGVLGRPFRVRKVPAFVRGKHARDGDRPFQEGVQARLVETVGGESAVPPVHEETDAQGTVQAAGYLIDFPVEGPDEVHDALAGADADLADALGERHLHAFQGQFPFFGGKESFTHVIRLPRSVS